MKNKVLITSAKVAIATLMVSVCMLDSDSWLPFIVMVVSFIYLFIFYMVNEKELERWLERK